MRMKLGLGAVLVGAALVMGACGGDDGPVGPDGTTTVRVINTSPDAPSVDVVVSGDVIGTGILYTQSTGYTEVDKEPDNLTVKMTNSQTVILDSGLSTDEQQGYSIFVMGRAAGLVAVQFLDDLQNPPVGNAKLRIVQAAASTSNVDVYVTAPGANLATATPTATNLSFKSATQYFQVPTGTYEIRITTAGTKTVLADLNNIALTDQMIRTAPFVDHIGGGAPFSVYTLVDKN